MAAKRTCNPALAEPTQPTQPAAPHPGAGHLLDAANGGVARQQARERLGFTPSAGVNHAGDALRATTVCSDRPPAKALPPWTSPGSGGGARPSIAASRTFAVVTST